MSYINQPPVTVSPLVTVMVDSARSSRFLCRLAQGLKSKHFNCLLPLYPTCPYGSSKCPLPSFYPQNVPARKVGLRKRIRSKTPKWASVIEASFCLSHSSTQILQHWLPDTVHLNLTFSSVSRMVFLLLIEILSAVFNMVCLQILLPK